VLPREDPRDAIVLPEQVRLPPDATSSVGSAFRRTIETLDDLVVVLGRSPSLGTGSVRRIAQLSRLFPGARFSPIRGNLDTRLRKLDAGEHDALVLAAAGLRRLGFGSRISFLLPASGCVPAPGQGIVAVETREDDEETGRIVAGIDDPPAAAALSCERALVEALGGGCQTPIGALATVDDNGIELTAAVVSVDGARAVSAQGRGSLAEPAALGRQVAEELRSRGADEILAAAERVPGAVQGLQP
jgi:hydroxymethylbilane synthase